MSKFKERILTKYIENLGNVLSGGIAMMAVSMLINDATIVIENIAMAAVLFIVALFVYFAFAAVVIARTDS